MQNINTGSYISIASLIVAALSYFGVVLSQDTIVTIIAGLVALYGVVHQIVVTHGIAKTAGIS